MDHFPHSTLSSFSHRTITPASPASANHLHPLASPASYFSAIAHHHRLLLHYPLLQRLRLYLLHYLLLQLLPHPLLLSLIAIAFCCTTPYCSSCVSPRCTTPYCSVCVSLSACPSPLSGWTTNIMSNWPEHSPRCQFGLPMCYACLAAHSNLYLWDYFRLLVTLESTLYSVYPIGLFVFHLRHVIHLFRHDAS